MTANEELFPWESEMEAAARLRREAAGEAGEERDADRSAAAGRDARRSDAVDGATERSEAVDEESAEGPQDVVDDREFEEARHRAELDFEPRPGPASVPAPRERRIAPREYYAISEVCEITGLKPHVLRYWETQFPLLNPSKNRSGNRVYQRKEIRLILLVKELLYEEKYTVEGAKAKLEQLRGGGDLALATGHALDRRMLQLLQADLRQLSELLTPPRK